MKFEKQVLDRYGPAQVGFGRRSDLTVYIELVFADPRLSSQALRLTREFSYAPKRSSSLFATLARGVMDSRVDRPGELDHGEWSLERLDPCMPAGRRQMTVRIAISHNDASQVRQMSPQLAGQLHTIAASVNREIADKYIGSRVGCQCQCLVHR